MEVETRQWTYSMHLTTSPPNLFAEAQSRHRTDALKHRLVSGKAQTPHRTDSVMQMLVSELIPYSTQPLQGSDSLKHRLISEMIP